MHIIAQANFWQFHDCSAASKPQPTKLDLVVAALKSSGCSIIIITYALLRLRMQPV